MLASSSFGARHTAETPRLVLEFADFWFSTPNASHRARWKGAASTSRAARPTPRADFRHRIERPETLAAHAPGPAEGKRRPGCQNSLAARPAASPGKDRTRGRGGTPTK